MKVTEIKAVTKTKFKVYLDGQFAFVLYKGELFRYRLKEGEELSKEDYQDIRQNIVLKRAKLRAMHLLADMDRTESQLRSRLRSGEYPEDIIDLAVEYVKSFGYINDLEYAKRFAESRKRTKSRKEIYMLLAGKGLDSSLIEEALETCCDSEDAQTAIREILRRKRFFPETATEKEKQKIYASLMRKGFRYEDIRQVIQISEWNA
ncbi:MAG: regulatory protein RecX [Eubacteriales bacterium]|nr:regulatory protein RecX [Eubacteriales bacterium]